LDTIFINQPIIAVNATALNSGGGRCILQQFISYLSADKMYYIFINKGSDINKSSFKNVCFIEIDASNGLKRTLWEWFGLKRWFKNQKLVPTVTISLQNTSIATHKKSKKIIYLHQGIFLHPHKWSFFKKNERALAFYKYIYPFFVFLFANKNTLFIVQTEWMKVALCNKFKRAENSVQVIKPKLVSIDVENIKTLPLSFERSLFYPAACFVYKNHREIIYALNELQNRGVDISTIGVYLTIAEDDDTALSQLIHRFNLRKNVQFLGSLCYEDVLIYYKSCNVVVFPSLIESFGLPLLEAAAFGKPIIALDAEYSRDVISDYEDVQFADKHSPKAWGDAILRSFTFVPLLKAHTPTYETNWDSFFKLIDEKMRVG